MAIALDPAIPISSANSSLRGDADNGAALQRGGGGRHPRADGRLRERQLADDLHRHSARPPRLSVLGRVREGTYVYRQTDPTMIRGETIWQRMSDAGKRSRSSTCPTPWSRELNGVMVSEWGCHDRHFGTASWPPELVGELTARHGEHFGSMSPPGFDQFAPCDYAHRIGQTARTTRDDRLLRRGPRLGVEQKAQRLAELLDQRRLGLLPDVCWARPIARASVLASARPRAPRRDPELARPLQRRPGAHDLQPRRCRPSATTSPALARTTPPTWSWPTGWPPTTTATTCSTTGLFTASTAGSTTRAAYGRATRAAAEAARWIPRPLRGRALRAAAPLIPPPRRRPGPRPDPARRGGAGSQVPNNTCRRRAVQIQPGGPRAVRPDPPPATCQRSSALARPIGCRAGQRRHRRQGSCASAFTDDVYDPRPATPSPTSTSVGALRADRARLVARHRHAVAGGLLTTGARANHAPGGCCSRSGPGSALGAPRGTFESHRRRSATLAAAVRWRSPEADGRSLIAPVLPGGVSTFAAPARTCRRMCGSGARWSANSRGAGPSAGCWAERQQELAVSAMLLLT